MKIYSRLLYTEHEQPHNDDGEGAYTFFSTQQLFGADCVPLGNMSFQKFSVLWEGQIVINEDALMQLRPAEVRSDL